MFHSLPHPIPFSCLGGWKLVAELGPHAAVKERVQEALLWNPSSTLGSSLTLDRPYQLCKPQFPCLYNGDGLRREGLLGGGTRVGTGADGVTCGV